MDAATAIPPKLRQFSKGAGRKLGAISSGAAFLAVGLILYIYEPTHVHFYPQCVFHTWTGLACPGCGGLRAAHQLLHGHILTATRFNPLFVNLVPVVLVVGGQAFYASLTGREAAASTVSPRVGWALFWTTIAFSIVRNLPIYPFPQV